MSTGKLEALCLRVGDRLFAVDIYCIREILRGHAVTPVPNAPPELAGVVNLRGDLVPVLDLHRALLRRDRGEPEEEARLVVVRSAGIIASLLVDQVLEVVSVPVEALRPVPGTAARTSAVVAAFQEEGEGGDVVLLLRVSSFFREGGLCVSGDAP